MVYSTASKTAVFLFLFITLTEEGELSPSELETLNKNLIRSSVPSKLKICSTLIIEESQVESNERDFNTIMDLMALQDKFLLSFTKPRNQNQAEVDEQQENKTKNSFRPIVDVHKLRDPCVIAFVQVTSQDSAEFLFTLILEYLYGVIKKDEDYFIFHSHNKDNIVSVFSEGPVAPGIKNKLGIILYNANVTQTQLSSSSYISTCFFCSPTHGPSLKEIPFPEPGEYNDNGTNDVSFLFPDFLDHFNGKEFTVSSPVLAKWLIEIEETSPGDYKIKRGIYNFAMQHLMRRYNFTERAFPSIGGGGTGYRYPNGTWIGTVGDILSGRSELAQTTGQILSRNAVVGFSFPISYEWLTFTTGEPKPFYSWKSIFWPFTKLIWGLVLISLCISFAALTTLLNVAIEGRVPSRKLAARKAFSYLLRTFLEQDATSLETTRPYTGGSPTTRVFIGFWLMFALVVSTAYRSKLVSVLAFPSVEEPPKTFIALAKSTKYQFALQYLRGAAYSLMKTSPNPTFQTIFNRMELEENDAKCFQRCIDVPRFSCISWEAVASFVAQKNLSDKYGQVPLVKSQDTSTFIAVGIIFKRRAVFRIKFDTVLGRAAALGLSEKWKELDFKIIRSQRSIWEKAMNMTRVMYLKDDSDVLTLRNLVGTFSLWGVGIITALVCFGVEGFVYWKWKFKREKASSALQLLVRTRSAASERDANNFSLSHNYNFPYCN